MTGEAFQQRVLEIKEGGGGGKKNTAQREKQPMIKIGKRLSDGRWNSAW